MPVHDWTCVEAGIFHDLHVSWIPELKKALNGGLLPEGYYALSEQHAGQMVADVLTLHVSPALSGQQKQAGAWPSIPATGGMAVAAVAPRVRRRETLSGPRYPRTLAIRHVSGHRLVALLEIVSPANKDRSGSLEVFASKAAQALNAGVHLLVVDLFPPGPHDPRGIHDVIRSQVGDSDEPYELPAGEPMTLASYAAGPPVAVYLEHLRVGADLPDMPLFLHPERYINVPLESTYRSAYQTLPAFWRDVLEGRRQPS
ncbi:MAG TPA: DUF4058 family protein [Phycisphaerae bacterium]|jgi:hypothetical protein